MCWPSRRCVLAVLSRNGRALWPISGEPASLAIPGHLEPLSPPGQLLEGVAFLTSRGKGCPCDLEQTKGSLGEWNS